MSGTMIACILIFGPFVIGALHGLYMDHYGATGKHQFGPSDMRPAGQVWFHDGTWWTFTRLKADRVPRLFDRRANPLDHELIYETVPVPDRVRRIAHEREYHHV